MEAVFQGVEALAVVIGIAFAMLQIRQARADKRREAALELLRSFQSPDFARALNLVYRLPEGLSREEVEAELGEDFHLVYALMTTWESVGVLVCRGELDLDLVDDFFSGPIRISWRKLQGHVRGEREALGRETIEEWFQWLAERLEEREADAPPTPAHIAYRDWPAVRPPPR